MTSRNEESKAMPDTEFETIHSNSYSDLDEEVLSYLDTLNELLEDPTLFFVEFQASENVVDNNKNSEQYNETVKPIQKNVMTPEENNDEPLDESFNSSIKDSEKEKFNEDGANLDVVPMDVESCSENDLSNISSSSLSPMKKRVEDKCSSPSAHFHSDISEFSLAKEECYVTEPLEDTMNTSPKQSHELCDSGNHQFQNSSVLSDEQEHSHFREEENATSVIIDLEMSDFSSSDRETVILPLSYQRKNKCEKTSNNDQLSKCKDIDMYSSISEATEGGLIDISSEDGSFVCKSGTSRLSHSEAENSEIDRRRNHSSRKKKKKRKKKKHTRCSRSLSHSTVEAEYKPLAKKHKRLSPNLSHSESLLLDASSKEDMLVRKDSKSCKKNKHRTVSSIENVDQKKKTDSSKTFEREKSESYSPVSSLSIQNIDSGSNIIGLSPKKERHWSVSPGRRRSHTPLNRRLDSSSHYDSRSSPRRRRERSGSPYYRPYKFRPRSPYRRRRSRSPRRDTRSYSRCRSPYNARSRSRSRSWSRKELDVWKKSDASPKKGENDKCIENAVQIILGNKKRSPAKEYPPTNEVPVTQSDTSEINRWWRIIVPYNRR